MISATLPVDEDFRLLTLEKLGILDSVPEERFNRIVRLAARQFQVPICLVTLVGRDRQWFKAKTGLDVSQTSREVSFCAHAILDSGPFIVPDTNRDPRFADNPLVTGQPFIRFYAGVPIRAYNGQPVGTFSIIDKCPREIDEEGIQALMDFGALVEGELRREQRLDKLQNLAFISRKYNRFEGPDIPHAEIAEDLLRYSNARFVVLNEQVPGSTDVVTRAVAGDKKALGGVENLLGFPLVGRRWQWEEHLTDLRQSRHLSRVGPVDQLSRQVSPEVGRYLKETLELENVYYIGIFDEEGNLWGNLQLLMPAGQGPENSSFKEAFAEIIGLYLGRLRTKARLEREKKRLETSQRNARIGYWQNNIETGEMNWSPVIYEIFGLEKGKLPLNMDLYHALIYPEDLPRVLAAEVEARRTGEMDIVYRIILPDRSIRYIHELAQPGDESLKDGYLAGTLQDITDYKETERMLGRAQKIAKLGSWYWEPETNYIYWSEQTYRIFGKDPATYQVNFENYINEVYPDDRERLVNAIQKARDKGAAFGVEHRLAGRRSGVWVYCRGEVIADAAGETLRLQGTIQDISERKETEERLKGILRAVDNSALVSTTDVQGVITHANPQFCAVSGYREEELIGQTHRIINSGFHSREFWREMWTTIRAGKTWRAEVRNRAKNGSFYWVDTVINPVYNSNGELESFFSIRYLVTDKKNQEEELRHREYQLQEATRIAHVGRWELDLVTNKLHWSDGIYELFELEPRKFPATYEAFLNAVHPEDREAVNQAYTDSLETKEPYYIQHRLLMPDGRVKWVMERCRTDYSPQGQALRSVGIVQDITELKETENELRRAKTLLEQVSEVARVGGWELDLVNNKLYWSRVTREIHEVNQDFQPDLENAIQFYAPGVDRDLISRAVGEAIEQGIPYDLELEVITTKGRRIWVNSIGYPEERDGEVVRLYGTLQDITFRKNAERELQQAKLDAEASNRAKSKFLSSMSHELRTPMNAIMGFAQLLEMNVGEKLGDMELENVSEILRAGRHLLDLINEILDLSRIESGHIDLSLEDIEIGPVFDEVRKIAVPLAGKKDVEISFDKPARETKQVRADRIQLKQILLNLISNAIKYNRPGGRVWVRMKSRSGDRIRILVEDTGHGIPEARQSELFQPFQRLGAEATDVEGTGIGLVITRQLVEIMGGEIGVDSQPGKGSTFWVEFPAGSPGEDGPMETPVTDENQPVDPLEARATILYIEDNPANLRLVSKFIARYPKVRLLTAHTGTLGVELAELERVDLFLLDINLPGLNGYEILELLRKSPRYGQAPVIALSANAMESDIQRGLRAGFDEYLTKPIQLGEISSVLNRYLAGGTEKNRSLEKSAPENGRKED